MNDKSKDDDTSKDDDKSNVEMSPDTATDAIEADFKDEAPDDDANNASADTPTAATSPWSDSAPNADVEPDTVETDATDQTTEAAAATVVAAAALAAGSAMTGADETPAQAPDAEQERSTPVLAYIWLAVLTVGIAYLIYGEMTRGEAFEATAAKASAAEQASNANSAAIAGLGDFAELSQASDAQATQLAALEVKIAEATTATTAALEAMKANAGGGTAGDVSPNALKAALADIESVRDAAVAAQAATATQIGQLTEAVAALNARLAPLEERANKSAGMSLASAILALNDLRDAVSTGKPFDKLLERARAVLPDDETLKSAPWTEFGDRGLPTEATLLSDMQDISIAIGQDKLKDRLNSGENWLDKAVGGVVGRLKVRRVGAAVEGDGPAAVAARAEAAMLDGDLNRAIEEVTPLEGADAERFASWLSGAKAVATASANIDAIEEAAVAAADGT